MSTPTYYVATSGGFLIYDEDKHYDVHPDSRMASSFTTWKEADFHAKRSVSLLFGRLNQYYSILTNALNVPNEDTFPV